MLKPIRILLVDDHRIIREALRVVLEQDSGLRIVGEAGDGESALALAEKLQPDVVVMDIAMPGMTGIEATRQLSVKHPHIKVLALSTYLNRSIIQQMLAAGASSYIAKSAAGVELNQGIHSIVAGRSYLCHEATQLMTDRRQGSRDSAYSQGEMPLSWREIQVTTLLAAGKSAPEIGVELHIAASTVEVHRRNIMRKLDINNVVELTKYAIRMGLAVS